jgi:5-methylcytosine-specific restriction endonuclease McrA
MSQLPYFPLYPTDFEADTSHLTLEEDGAYNRLLRLMWMTPGCSLPDDDAWLMRRMRCDAETFARVVLPVIAEFFTRAKGRVFSPLIEEFCSRYRSREARPWIPLAIQREVLGRDGRKCAYCGGTSGPFHLDHIIPWSRGGENTSDNLNVACARCNWSKGNKTLEEWRLSL